jgi:hypothetical protein
MATLKFAVFWSCRSQMSLRGTGAQILARSHPFPHPAVAVAAELHSHWPSTTTSPMSLRICAASAPRNEAPCCTSLRRPTLRMPLFSDSNKTLGCTVNCRPSTVRHEQKTQLNQALLIHCKLETIMRVHDHRPQ